MHQASAHAPSALGQGVSRGSGLNHFVDIHIGVDAKTGEPKTWSYPSVTNFNIIFLGGRVPVRHIQSITWRRMCMCAVRLFTLSTSRVTLRIRTLRSQAWGTCSTLKISMRSSLTIIKTAARSIHCRFRGQRRVGELYEPLSTSKSWSRFLTRSLVRNSSTTLSRF